MKTIAVIVSLQIQDAWNMIHNLPAQLDHQHLKQNLAVETLKSLKIMLYHPYNFKRLCVQIVHNAVIKLMIKR